MILQDDTGITVTDASNPQKKTKVTSGGLFITTDGGATWKNAIRGEGIATQYLTAGNINVGSIVLLDGQFPAFRWDKTGIDAYSPLPEDGGIDLGKFVRFDHFGIYGINGESSEEFTPETEDDVWDNAQFGMTWDGFFMKTTDNDGQIEVSSKNDIRVLSNDKERIKIGRIIENDTQYYGIRISDDSGPVLETINTGELWLKKQLQIKSTDGTNYNIALGYLDSVKENSSIHEVFNANDKFVVYEDGSMKATDGEFTGAIYATGGKIGNMTIGEIEETVTDVRKLEIQSDLGYTYKVEGEQVNPISLVLKVKSIGFTISSDQDIVWYGSSDFSSWQSLGTGLIQNITYSHFKEKQSQDVYFVKAVYSSRESLDNYTASAALYQVKNGTSPIEVVIVSSSGNIFINGEVSTSLTAYVYRGNEDITSTFDQSLFSWEKINEDGSIDEDWTNSHKNYGNIISINSSTVDRKASFNCIVDI